MQQCAGKADLQGKDKSKLRTTERERNMSLFHISYLGKDPEILNLAHKPLHTYVVLPAYSYLILYLRPTLFPVQLQGSKVSKDCCCC